MKVSLVGGGAVRVAYTVMIGELPAAAARKIADMNGDGAVDDGEAGAWANALAQSVQSGLALDVDGKRLQARWEAPVIGGLENRQVAPIPFSVDLIARLETGGGTHTVRLDDTTAIPAVGDTEVRIEEGPGAKLLAAWHAREDGKIQTRFAWTGPRRSVVEDRSIGFRFRDESAPRSRRSPVLPIGLFGVGVGAAVALYLVRRARRPARSSGG
ncbi:MAG: hypothetical protein EXR72_09270 [Myxococcales bacterium]|nr:hypothetical protein [Myxococcales bacterium]